ncbi:MFS transporter small subunit [Hymenobacter baengnokdamensis]|nr:oxalate:formate antiporter [Hymenobacter baengnokdamensis]
MNPKPNAAPPVVTEESAGGSVILAWLFVGVPLVWGVSQTFIKALTLFK